MKGHPVLAPFTVEEAVQLLIEVPARPLPIAGGTHLMRADRLAALDPERVLLDLRRIDALRRLAVEGEELVLGAGLTPADLVASPEVRRRAPLLVAAARAFVEPWIRGRATLGGQVAVAAPDGDLATALLAVDAAVVLASDEGRRRVPLFSFWLETGRTAASARELIVEIRVPAPAERTLHVFRRIGACRHGGPAKLVLAASCSGEGRERCRLRLALGGVGPVPTRIRESERVLALGGFTAEPIARAVKALDGEITPVDDLHSTAAYRRLVARRLVRGFLEEIAGRSDFSGFEGK